MKTITANVRIAKAEQSKLGINPDALMHKQHMYWFDGGAVYSECVHIHVTLSHSELEISHVKPGDTCIDIRPITYGNIIRCRSRLPKSEQFENWITTDTGKLLKVDQCEKIIASTDTSLNVAKTSHDFIEYIISLYNDRVNTNQQINIHDVQSYINVELTNSTYDDWLANGASPVPTEKVETINNEMCYSFVQDKTYTIPADLIDNIMGYIDTLIHRRKIPADVVDNIVALRKHLSNYNTNN